MGSDAARVNQRRTGTSPQEMANSVNRFLSTDVQALISVLEVFSDLVSQRTGSRPFWHPDSSPRLCEAGEMSCFRVLLLRELAISEDPVSRPEESLR